MRASCHYILLSTAFSFSGLNFVDAIDHGNCFLAITAGSKEADILWFNAERIGLDSPIVAGNLLAIEVGEDDFE